MPAEDADGGKAPGPGRPGPAALVVLAALVLTAAATLTAASAGARTAPDGRTPAAHPPTPAEACASGGQYLWAHLTECGWPGSSNTGPDLTHCPGGQLSARGDGVSPIVIRTPGTRIQCEELRGLVTIAAPNVTIADSVVDAKSGTGASGSTGILVRPGASATIDHVAVDGAEHIHACVWHEGTRLVVHALNCEEANDGVFTWAPTGHSPIAGDDFTITDSYFHDFTQATANGHDDGYQTEGASHGLLEHNTFEMNASSTSAVSLWDSRESATDIDVTDNLITGGSFSVYAEDYSPGTGAPGMPSAAGGNTVSADEFTGNVFSTFASGCVGKYGVWFTRALWVPYQGGPTDGWHRQDNVVLETGQNVDHGNPSDNGRLCR